MFGTSDDFGGWKVPERNNAWADWQPANTLDPPSWPETAGIGSNFPRHPEPAWRVSIPKERIVNSDLMIIASFHQYASNSFLLSGLITPDIGHDIYLVLNYNIRFK